MARRRDNMLEAFRQSEESEQPTAEMLTPLSTEAAGARHDAGPDEGPDPFAAQEREPEDDPFVPMQTEGGALPQPQIVIPEMPDGGVHLPLGKEAFVVLQVLALAIVFLLGRLTAPASRTVAAAETQAGLERGARFDRSSSPANESAGVPAPVQTESDPTSGASGAVPAGPRDGAAGPEAAESAFHDPVNRQSILAITQNDSEWGSHLAWESYDHLTSLGIPAIQPRRKGTKIVVLVGAAPTKDGLEDLLRRLKETRGPDDRLSYADAYRVNLDSYR